jgi:tetratricopeptide (TPR) repeat protein
LKRNPDHVGAIHLYIHAVEASTTPERAEPFADRLARKEIGAGHLVHMPSHIYYRIGRYADSLEVNRRAVATDEAFFAKVAPEGLYAGGYYPHNIHFLLVSAQMAGDGPTAIEAAGKLSLAISDDLARVAPAFVQPIKAAPLFAHAQFSDPDTILAIERPSGDFPFIDAVWHYMRGVGQAAQGNVAAAKDELTALRDIAATADLSAHQEGGMPAGDILTIAVRVLEARIAQSRGDWAEAARAFADAKAIEDGLSYMEPRHWYYPVGQSLGATLLRIGDLDGAEKAFKESLALAPNNGWSLFGLSEVYRARGDTAKAEMVTRQWKNAWTGDTSLLRLDRL